MPVVDLGGVASMRGRRSLGASVVAGNGAPELGRTDVEVAARCRTPDPRVAVWERAAETAKLTGRRREVGRLYFLGKSGKEIMRATKIAEGTFKRDLAFLHGRMGSSKQAEFVHCVYEMAYGNGPTGSSRAM
jgi:DNA-binding NarL/FixJ family response regulator